MLRRIEHEGDVLELRLERPPANALDPGLVRELLAALEEAPEARALVLSGTPGMFSAGLDVPALLDLERDAMATFLGDFLALLRSLATSPRPIVAALTGHAPAGGAVLAIHCDHRVQAAGPFKLGLNEVRVGLPLPRVIHSTLVRIVGARQAERLGVRGLLVSPDEAFRIGLVDELVAPESVVETAAGVALDYLAIPARAMRDTRRMARRELEESFAREERATWESFVEDWFTDETQGALRALVARLQK